MATVRTEGTIHSRANVPILARVRLITNKTSKTGASLGQRVYLVDVTIDAGGSSDTITIYKNQDSDSWLALASGESISSYTLVDVVSPSVQNIFDGSASPSVTSRPLEVAGTATGFVPAITTFPTVRASGIVSNTGDLSITVRAYIVSQRYSSAGALVGSPVTVRTGDVTINPGGSLALSVQDDLVLATGEYAAVAAQVDIVAPGGSERTLLTSQAVRIDALVGVLNPTGGFALERQVRYNGGLDGTARRVYIVLTAYLRDIDPTDITLRYLRSERSANFDMPTSKVPQIVVPVYATDPSGLLWGGMKIFDAANGVLIHPTDRSEAEVTGGPLWALNAGSVRVDGSPSGKAYNLYGKVNYNLTVPLLPNAGDAAMTVRVLIKMNVTKKSTGVDMGVIPGTDYQQDITIPSGGSSGNFIVSRGPFYAPEPYYTYLNSSGYYIKMTFRVSAMTAGIVSGAYSYESWNIAAPNESITL